MASEKFETNSEKLNFHFYEEFTADVTFSVLEVRRQYKRQYKLQTFNLYQLAAGLALVSLQCLFVLFSYLRCRHTVAISAATYCELWSFGDRM